MKNLFKILGATALMLALSTSGLMAQKVVFAGNSGNIIQKNAGFFYDDAGICTGTVEYYPEQSSTVLIQGNGTIKITIHIDMTGSCLVPTSGGAVVREEPLIDDGGNVIAIGTFRIAPSGMATYKVTF